MKFYNLIFLIFISSILYSNLALGKKTEIYEDNYFDEFIYNENTFQWENFQNQCVKDIKNIENKIKNNSIKLDKNYLINYNLNSLLCYIQTMNLIAGEKNLLFLINEYEKGNIIKNSDTYNIFKFSILPVADQYYPALNLMDLITLEEIEEVLLLGEFMTDIDSKNLLIHIAAINLYKKNKKEEIKKYLDKGIINKDNQMNLWSSIFIQSDYSLITDGTEKIENNIKSIKLINKYLNLYENSQMLWLKGILIDNTGYLLRKQKRFDESLNFLINNINDEEVQKMEPSLIQPYIEIYNDIGRLREGFFRKNENNRSKYGGQGYLYFKKAALLFVEKIIENENYLIEITDFHANLKESEDILYNFLTSRMYYFEEIITNDDSISLDEKRKLYWGDDFNLALKVNQILMTHEVGRSLEYLENKVYSKKQENQRTF